MISKPSPRQIILDPTKLFLTNAEALPQPSKFQSAPFIHLFLLGALQEILKAKVSCHSPLQQSQFFHLHNRYTTSYPLISASSKPTPSPAAWAHPLAPSTPPSVL
ncbi:hypothetical protein TWF694_005871 [Orbilia ellipsospora]|uniref:Uncharacterized protein n=1 Tax=Orbilia ellipsospora TaxID=2528407 RepID=A0AAV9WS62_9PEZI